MSPKDERFPLALDKVCLDALFVTLSAQVHRRVALGRRRVLQDRWDPRGFLILMACLMRGGGSQILQIWFLRLLGSSTTGKVVSQHFATLIVLTHFFPRLLFQRI